VKILPTSRKGPGAAKAYGTLANEGSHPSGATITCALQDANARKIATTTSTVEYVEPHKSVTFGAGATYQTTPVTAACKAEPRPPVSPARAQPPTPRFQLSGAAFFDADHGIAVGSFGTARLRERVSRTDRDDGRRRENVDSRRADLISHRVSHRVRRPGRVGCGERSLRVHLPGPAAIIRRRPYLDQPRRE
jgi:hypothetical protein